MEISEFDTLYTLRIKKAYQQQIPYKFILYNGEAYISLFDFIGNGVDDNQKIVEIYKAAEPYLTDLDYKDFYIAYYYVAKDKLNTNDESLFQKINTLIDEINLDNRQNNDVLEQNNLALSQYQNVSELLEDINFWSSNFQEEIIKNQKLYESLITSQKILENTKPVDIKMNSINIIGSKLEFNPKFVNLDSEEITPEDGIEIFDQLIPSINIPFIQYNDPLGKPYYKIYEELSLNFDNIIPTTSETRKANYIYFKVSVIKDIKDIKNDAETIKKNYELCSYNLIKNKLTVNVFSEEKDIVVNRIRSGFKYVNVGEYKETSIKGEFYVPDVGFNFSNLHYLLFNDNHPDEDLNGVFSNYVFIDETKNTFINSPAQKMSLKYKTLGNKEEDEEKEETEDDFYSINPSALTLKFKQYSSSFSFIKAKNMETLVQFIKIFSRLITIYKEYDEYIYDMFSEVIPELKTVEKKEIVSELIDEKIKNLRNIAPDVFTKGTVGYSRLCSCDHQPIIVSDDSEAKDWRNKTFIDKKENEEKYRQIATYPPKKEEALFRFTCPTDERPYPYLVENNTEENSETYPYVPCCGKEDKLDDFYNIYYKEDKEKIKSYKSYEINTIKVLEYKRTGKVPSQIQNLLSSYNTDEKYEFNRIGTVRSVNSLIHCIMISLQDINDDATEYRNLDNNEQREEFCKSIRKKMINSFPDLNVYKQELYDISIEEIKDKLENENEFLDPALYYRGLEELYNINIFTFVPESDGTKEPSIEIPRHKFTHIRPDRPERDSIIIFKHNGGESEDLRYSQCELIFNSGKLKDTDIEKKEDIDKKGRGRPKKEEKQKEALTASEKSEYFFGINMTNILYQTLEKFSKSYIFSFSKNPDGLETNKIQIRLNPYSSVFYNDILRSPIKIISQFIDGYGKTRIINIKVAQYKISLFVPPTQPFNVVSSLDVYTTTSEVVSTIFGEPKKTIKEGFWYSIIDYEYGLFIPCVTKSTAIIPEAPVLYKNTEKREIDSITKYRNIKKYYNWFRNLVIWGLRSNGVLDLKDLNNLPKYIKIVDKIDYNVGPKILDRRLPKNQNFSYLHNWWPEYFTKDNKVKMTVSLYDKMYKMIKRDYTIKDGLSLAPEKYLQDIYETEEDFMKYINSRLIIGINHLEMWRKQRKSGVSTEAIIYKDLTKTSLLNQEEPFLYLMESMTGESKIYIIQNIKTGNILRASFVSKTWVDSKYNIGAYVSDEEIQNIENEKFETVIYTINPSYKIVYYRQENITEKTTEYNQLLYNQSTGYYHAMLPLV
jgi:hypothetical protein